MISFNIKEFVSELNEDVENIFEGFEGAIEGAAMFGWEKIVAATPVDTGRASSSWNISSDPDDFIELEPTPKGTFVYSPYRPEFKFDIWKDSGIYITNNVEYIDYLENGCRNYGAFRMVQDALPNIKRSLNLRLTSIRKKAR